MSIYLCNTCNRFHDTKEQAKHCNHLKVEPVVEPVEFDREALKAEAVKLGLEFSPNIGSKKLFELIEAEKTKA